MSANVDTAQKDDEGHARDYEGKSDSALRALVISMRENTGSLDFARDDNA